METAKHAISGSLAPERQAGLISAYKEMDPNERRALKACWGGWLLDGMDTQMFSFVIPTLIAVWGITRADAGKIGTTMLIASAVGGWIAGYLSDRVGRVRTLQITICWFAVFSLLSAFCQTYDQLLVVRGLMGLGFGGEYAAGAVLLSESVRPEHRGKALGLMGSGFAVGWGLAALLFTGIFALVPAADAWRLLFIVGVLPALLIFFVRRFVHDPTAYQAAKSATKESMSPFYIFQPELLRRTIVCSLLSTGGQAGYVTIMTWLPSYLNKERGFSTASTGGYVLVTVVGTLFGYLAGAYLSDAIGRKASLRLFGISAAVTFLIYGAVPTNDILLLCLGLPLGFFMAGSFSVVPSVFSEMYPTRCRGLGLGFVHNFGRAFGAVAPFLVGVYSQTMGLGVAMTVFGAGGFAIMVLFSTMVPETRGRVLD
jgi:MFS family permease